MIAVSAGARPRGGRGHPRARAPAPRAPTHPTRQPLPALNRDACASLAAGAERILPWARPQVCTEARAPTVTRTFEVEVPRGLQVSRPGPALPPAPPAPGDAAHCAAASTSPRRTETPARPQVHKRITYTNPYSAPRRFHLRSTHPGLVGFRPDILELGVRPPPGYGSCGMAACVRACVFDAGEGPDARASAPHDARSRTRHGRSG